MKRIGHWTPHYIFYRLSEIIYQHKFPDHPWLTKAANAILESFLTSDDVGLEFGSGRSTIWFAKKIKFLTSVEHNEEWFTKVKAILQKEKIENVRYILAPENAENKDVPEYLAVFNDLKIESLDFVLVDGIYRDMCACACIKCIKRGGILILDNANWYLPSNSKSPNSRSTLANPVLDDWAKFEKLTESWRCIWTTNGVSDTVVFFKPPN